jgi:hypothetical protein
MTKIFRVRPGILRMRRQPSADARVIERLTAGQAVVRLRDTDPDPWWLVFADVAGRGIFVGYVHSEYLTPVLLPGPGAGASPDSSSPAAPEPSGAAPPSGPSEGQEPGADGDVSGRIGLGVGDVGPGAPVAEPAPVCKDWIQPADRGPRSGATRLSGEPGMRTFALGEPVRPDYPSVHPQGAAPGIIEILRWLDCGNRQHLRWQPADGKTFCNIFTYDVSCLCGVYLPRVWWTDEALRKAQGGQMGGRPQTVRLYAREQGDTVQEVSANALFDWLEAFGEVFGWAAHADVTEAQDAANAGRLVILSAKRNDPRFSGHINIIAPEHGRHRARRQNQKVTLPLQSNAGKSNYTIDQAPNEWWKRGEFKTYGFWSAVPK